MNNSSTTMLLIQLRSDASVCPKKKGSTKNSPASTRNAAPTTYAMGETKYELSSRLKMTQMLRIGFCKRW